MGSLIDACVNSMMSTCADVRLRNAESAPIPWRNFQAEAIGTWQELFFSVLQPPPLMMNEANPMEFGSHSATKEKTLAPTATAMQVELKEDKSFPVAAEGPHRAFQTPPDQIRVNNLSSEPLSLVTNNGERQQVAELKQNSNGEQRPFAKVEEEVSLGEHLPIPEVMQGFTSSPERVLVVELKAEQNPREAVTQQDSPATSQTTPPPGPRADEVDFKSCMSGDSSEFNENSARELLKNSGWTVSQSVRRNGTRQWYYRSPPRPKTLLLGSLTSAMALWKKALDKQRKQEGGGDDDPHPLVTAFLNKMKKPSKNRKKRLTL